MGIFSGQFWKDAAERIVSSAAQGFITGAGLGNFLETGKLLPDLANFPWEAGLAGAVSMAVLTLAKCLIAAPLGDTGTASLVEVQPATPAENVPQRDTQRPDTRTSYTRVELPSQQTPGPDHAAGPDRPPFQG